MCSLVRFRLLMDKDATDPDCTVGNSFWVNVSSVTCNVMAWATTVQKHSIAANTPMQAIGLLFLLMVPLCFSTMPLGTGLHTSPSLSHPPAQPSATGPCLRRLDLRCPEKSSHPCYHDAQSNNDWLVI